jgi:hypothetical protein
MMTGRINTQLGDVVTVSTRGGGRLDGRVVGRTCESLPHFDVATVEGLLVNVAATDINTKTKQKEGEQRDAEGNDC